MDIKFSIKLFFRTRQYQYIKIWKIRIISYGRKKESKFWVSDECIIVSGMQKVNERNDMQKWINFSVQFENNIVIIKFIKCMNTRNFEAGKRSTWRFELLL